MYIYILLLHTAIIYRYIAIIHYFTYIYIATINIYIYTAKIHMYNYNIYIHTYITIIYIPFAHIQIVFIVPTHSDWSYLPSSTAPPGPAGRGGGSRGHARLGGLHPEPFTCGKRGCFGRIMRGTTVITYYDNT